MKTKFFLTLITVIVIGGLIFVYAKKNKERTVEQAHEGAITTESKTAKGTNGENILTLNDETQKRIALKVEPLIATNFTKEIVGYGRVLDPTSLAEQGAELASARVAAEVSRQEYDRLKTLGENTSVRALQTAAANSRRDELAVETAKIKMKLAWGQALAERDDLPEFLKVIVSSEKSLVRIELSPGETLPSNPIGARITSLNGAETVEAEFLGASPKIDAQTQGQGFLFLTKSKAVGLSPGAAVTGFIKVSGDALKGVVVPRSAVVRHDGKAFIYLKISAENFARREVNLETPTTAGWFISNLSADDPVVISGAQTLLSEESKAQFRLGD